MIESIKPNSRGAFAGELTSTVHIAIADEGQDMPYLFLDQPTFEEALNTLGQTNTVLSALKHLVVFPYIAMETRIVPIYERLVRDHITALSLCRI